MGGGLMQLVAYGAQDIYLTGNPQITFFKVVYRRHTNFSMESIQQTINGTSTLTDSTSSGTVTISRNGDLVSKIYVTSTGTGIENADNIIQDVELEIGGQLIDRQYKEWMQVWEELTTPDGKKPSLKHMKHAYARASHSGSDHLTGTAGHGSVNMIQIPLYFWFCRNPGLALPLIALQYHEVKLKFNFGSKATGTTANIDTSCAPFGAAGSNVNVQVWCDYIYLDTDERRRFAQVSHEYLIEQVQRQSSVGSASMKLNFNHPVKELIWTDSGNKDYVTSKLVLNGHDRFAEQEEEYFRLRQPFDYHTSVPNTNYIETGGAYETNGPTGIVYVADISGADAQGEFDSDSTTNLDIFETHRWYPHVGDIVQIDIFDINATPVYRGNCGNIRVTDVTATGTTGQFGVSGEGEKDHFVITFDTAWTGGSGSAVTFADGDIIVVNVVKHNLRKAFANSLTRAVNVYSFALKPEEHQPSGTCNFSRIDNAQLKFGTAPTGTVNIYAVNYNVLRIMSGMGGLAYSN